MTQPIKPSEIAKAKAAVIPEVVFEIANELIALTYCNGKARFDLSEFRERLKRSLLDNYRKEYLDIEDIYRDAGWSVTFHKPDYTEDWAAYYEVKG